MRAIYRIWLGALLVLVVPNANADDIDLKELSHANGQCTATLDGVDIGCTGHFAKSILNNERTLIHFTGRDIATLGFAGGTVKSTGATSAVLWVDRVYINQTVIPADGQCVVESEQGFKAECRAVLRDERKVAASLISPTAPESHSFGPGETGEASRSVQGLDCAKLMKTHGFLSRAQFQCGFKYYSNDMMETARSCYQTLGEDPAKEALTSGMHTFDRNEKELGHARLCKDVLKDFSNIVRK
jgi:hypothetical protein